MEKLTIVSLITTAGTISGVLFGSLGYFRGLKKDTFSAGAANGTTGADIAYIKRRIDDILLEQKDTNKSIVALTERIAKVEESAKSAHHRIDQIVEVK